MRGRSNAIHTLALILLLGGSHALAATPQELIERIKAVGTEGKGNTAAAGAWRELVAIGPPAVIPILKEFDDRRLVVVNWLRPAVDAIAERAAIDGRPLPIEELVAFLTERANPPLGRALAYELLCQADPSTPQRWLPRFLDDPSPDLRRAGVAAALIEAGKRLEGASQGPYLLAGLAVGTVVALSPKAAFLPGPQQTAILGLYEQTLAAAGDPDQVDDCAAKLRSLGREIDLAKKFGFVREWALVAPFDNSRMAGFNVAYPPEKGVDLSATYTAKASKKATWGGYRTTSNRGVVDLNDALGREKGAVGYAFAMIDSPTERPIEIRAGSYNAIKIWLNGKEVLSHEEYHHGMSVDQFVNRATLRAGKNELLVKVCQNEQTENWAQSWTFQLRLCDAAGAAVPFTVVTPKVPPLGQKNPNTPRDR